MTPRPRFYHDDGLNVRSYDARADLDARLFEDHLPFYVGMAREWGGPVLELGCGTGRIALAIAEAGIETTGLDLSRPMLARAEAKRAGAEDGIARRLRFVEGDMTDFALGSRFRLAIIPFRGFQELLTVHDQRAVLACLRDHLEEDGRLVLDLFDPRLEDVLPPVDDGVATLPALDLGGSALKVEVLRRTNAPLTQVLTEIWRFTETAPDGSVLRVEEEVHSLRWTWRFEMRHLLELAGFAVEAEHSDFHGSPPGRGRQQVWVARPSESVRS
ncbi:MAG: class I SAM-dependent methyltransferase [Alphaproteobacteria bacterium]|nr:class I SAM-dependent methyltransferase [Alphaproteobacteria bacterium]